MSKRWKLTGIIFLERRENLAAYSAVRPLGRTKHDGLDQRQSLHGGVAGLAGNNVVVNRNPVDSAVPMMLLVISTSQFAI